MRRRFTGFLTGLLLGVATSVLALSLTWTPPSQRIDGTAFSLSEIDHYTLYCGATLELDQTFVIDDPTATRQVIDDLLPDGDWFCAITVTDYLGLESEWSSVLSFTKGGGVVEPTVAKPNPPVINGAV